MGGLNEFYLRQGVQKLDQDLDVVNLLAMVKLFRSLRHLTFSRDERLFLKFKRRDTINSDIESSEAKMISSSEDEAKIIKLAEGNMRGIDNDESR